ncbi:protein NipSnap homolog 3A isoform X2 [Chrysemys picta bellii]|uniref:protein NipSnap homolog 3A isoform X2 n=1 Tax=Chrysemys picta bellii TaxID=8478 RepID=UPI0032B144C5
MQRWCRLFRLANAQARSEVPFALWLFSFFPFRSGRNVLAGSWRGRGRVKGGGVVDRCLGHSSPPIPLALRGERPPPPLSARADLRPRRHVGPPSPPPAGGARRRGLPPDNFAHRAEVRKAVASDKEWQGKFISPVLPFLNKQHNEIVYLVPWCEIGKPSKEGGVYEMVTFQMKPGGPALWGQSFRAAINAHLNTGYTKLIGVFHTEYGLLNRVHVLWWNENPDSRAAGRHYAHEDARVVGAVRESVRFLESQQNMLLIPMPCSPLK